MCTFIRGYIDSKGGGEWKIRHQNDKKEGCFFKKIYTLVKVFLIYRQTLLFYIFFENMTFAELKYKLFLCLLTD